MFLDSAQKLNSVVSHAKELNYLPQSNRSSVAFIGFTINATGISGSFSIPKGAVFVGTNSNGTYAFTTAENTTYVSPNSTFTVANLAIYEGTFVNDSYIVDYTNPTQRFILSNPNIDITNTSLSVSVSQNNGQTNTIFNQVSTLYNLNSNSNIYFLQPAQNGQYELVFGDGVLGTIPQNGAVVTANYRIAHGPEADGISNFTCSQNLGTFNGGQATLSTIVASSNSSSGGLAESIETIRFRAPRYFATQQRAVATDDYASLVLSQFGGEIADVNVYGGETITPAQFGKVVVCVKPKGVNNLIAPDYLKNSIVSYLQNYTSVSTRVLTSDPDYLYVKVNSTVQYDTTLTSLSPSDISSAVLQTIINYSNTNLGIFNNDFRYSRFVNDIDNTDVSIVSNDTSVILEKRFSPTPGVATTTVLEFNNAGEREGTYYGKTYPDEPTVYSTSFTYTDSLGNEYTDSYLRDDGNGNIIVYTVNNNNFVTINSNVGSINYDTGLVTINNVMLNYTGTYIAVYYMPVSKDLYASVNKILLIDPNDVIISVIKKQN